MPQLAPTPPSRLSPSVMQRYLKRLTWTPTVEELATTREPLVTLCAHESICEDRSRTTLADIETSKAVVF